MTELNFNPDSFIETEIQGALDTQLIPVPVGEWQAQIGEIKKMRQGTGKDGTQYFFLDIPWEFSIDQRVVEHCQRDKPTARQSISIDMKDDGNGNAVLDMGKGKNVGLGQIREIFGMNDPSRPWSPRMLQGRAALVKVKQTVDKQDPTKIYTDVQPLKQLG